MTVQSKPVVAAVLLGAENALLKASADVVFDSAINNRADKPTTNDDATPPPPAKPSAERAAEPSATAAQRLAAAWAWYLRQLDSRPLATKSSTAAVLGVISEALSRRLSNKPLLADFRSYRRQLLLGLLWRAPLLHSWLTVLNRLFQGWEKRSLRTVLTKTLVHEVVFDPAGTAAYMYILGRLDGRSHTEQSAIVCAGLWAALRRSYQVWPAVNLLNFLLVPDGLAVLFSNGVGVIMNALLTLRARHALSA